MGRIKYKDLMGQEVDVVFSSGEEAGRCFVAGIDRKVGITLKRLSNQSDAICIVRDISVKNRGKKAYDKQFNMTVRRLRKGFLDNQVVFKGCGLLSGNGVDMNTCAFL